MKDNFTDESEKPSLTEFLEARREELQAERNSIRRRLWCIGLLYGGGLVMIAWYDWRLSLGLLILILAHELFTQTIE